MLMREGFSCKTFEPVVVIPDTDSNSASVGLSCNSQNMKGSDPKTPISIHDPLVSKKACRSPRSSGSRCDVASHVVTPKKAVNRDEMAKTCQSPDPKYRSTHIGISMVAARIVVNRPRMFNTGENCIMVAGKTPALCR